MSLTETSKETIAHNMVYEVRSWSIGYPEPPRDTYECLICDYSTLGMEKCTNHVLEEHDDVLVAEMRMKGLDDRYIQGPQNCQSNYEDWLEENREVPA